VKVQRVLPAFFERQDKLEKDLNKSQNKPKLLFSRVQNSAESNSQRTLTDSNNSPVDHSNKNQSSKAYSSAIDFSQAMSGTPGNSSARRFEKSNMKIGSSGLETIEDNQELEYAHEEMMTRMRQKYEMKIPDIDLIDLDLERRPSNPKKRQFAPLYSHCAYKATLQ
jgi:hypothetical protein